MSKTVLVSYLESHKLIVIPADRRETSDLHYLQRCCLERFNFSVGSNVRIIVTLQKYDSDWDSYIDLDENYVADNRDKLKLIVSPALTDAASSTTTSAMEEVSGNWLYATQYGELVTVNFQVDQQDLGSVPLAESDGELNLVHTAKRRKWHDQFEDQDEGRTVGEEVQSSSQDAVEVLPPVLSVAKSKKASSRELESHLHLPDPFPLPQNFRSDVEVALKAGQMTRETNKSFFSFLAGSILNFKRYPTKEELTRVATEVIRKYPFMKSPTGSPIVSTLL